MYVDLFIQMINLIFLTSTKLHFMCTILSQIPPVRICRGEGEKSKQKSALLVMVMEGV